MLKVKFRNFCWFLSIFSICFCFFKIFQRALKNYIIENSSVKIIICQEKNIIQSNKYPKKGRRMTIFHQVNICWQMFPVQERCALACPKKNLFVDFEAGTLSRAAYIPQQPPTKIWEYFEHKWPVAIVFKFCPIYKGKWAIISQKILKWP